MDTTIVPDKLVLVDGILSGFGNDVHCFMNAADGFRDAIDGSGRPGMGLGLVRDCSGGVWTASRQD